MKVILLVMALLISGCVTTTEPRMTLNKITIIERSDGMVHEVHKEFVPVPGYNFWEDAGETAWKLAKKQLGL